MKSDTILSVRDLAISFTTNAGILHAIRGVDLDVKRGETVAIVGESGSGKSVTVKAAMGILASNGGIERGSMLYRYTNENGEEKEIDLLKLSKKEMRSKINGQRIAMVFQDPMTSLDPTQQIGKQIMEGMLVHGRCTKQEAKKRAIELLDMVGIPEPERRFRNYPHQLSGGMRQRVVIATALACSPELLICDGPTTALDVTIQARILDLIKDVQKKMDLSVIYITHDLGVVAKVADYVNVMYAGKIVERGTVDEIFYDPRHPYTWGLLAAMPDLDTNNERLRTIPGTPPSLLGDIQGDPFAERNPYALNIDRRQEPPMFSITKTHYAATWLLHENAPKVEMPEELRHRLQRMRKGRESNE